jgi:hypothetical protein
MHSDRCHEINVTHHPVSELLHYGTIYKGKMQSMMQLQSSALMISAIAHP